jgi:hypothetical protein
MATVGQAVTPDTPTVTGTVTSYDVNPALPAGLSLSSATGTISGTPTVVAVQAAYKVVASNSAGSTSATIQITAAAAVVRPTDLTYPQTTIAATVGQPITPDTPTISGTAASYTVTPTLPAGLALSSSTGTISGTPTTVAAQVSYTVTASNSAGSTSAAVLISASAPLPAPSNLTYPRVTIASTIGQPVTPDVPAVTGTVTSYAVVPALPPGLTLDGATGAISGTPTAVAAQATYTVLASNSGGNVSADIVIVVNSASGILLDLGHSSPILQLREEATSVLSQDNGGHWVLWNYASGGELASGDQFFAPTPSLSVAQWEVDMAGPTVVIGLTNSVEVRSSTDGHILSLIVSPMIDPDPFTLPAPTWWKLASDGSYICAGSNNGLSVWDVTGKLLVSKTGDYSAANVFAAPDQVQVAQGAAGHSVIETISIADGSSTVGPAFDGAFNSWFLDGNRFLTNEGNTVWTYSSASVKQAIIALPTVANLTGQGNWIWTYDSEGYSLDIYPVGGSSPAATFGRGVLAVAIPSGGTIGLLSYGTGAASVIDLSGSTPSKVDFTFPIAYINAYAAASGSQWLVGNQHGVIVDGASLTSGIRYFGFGTAWSIAGGTDRVAIATAVGQIPYFDPSLNTPEGFIGFSSSKLAMSSDGTVLAAAANTNDSQYESDATLNVFSLPSETVINSWPYTFYGSPTLFDFSLSGSGETIGQILGTLGTAPTVRQVTATSGGPILWSDVTPAANGASPIRLSPDGTLIAVSNGTEYTTSTTNIYKNGLLVTAVSGWVIGWIDNERVLVNTYAIDPITGLTVYAGAVIYNAAGTNIATPSLPELRSIQPVTADSIYSPQLNSIFSLTSGAPTWTSPNSSTGVGAVAGGYVVYASGSRVLADSY